jgi:hypothetical protein
MVGVCLVAIFAVAAFASSSAMALPEWGKCEAKVGGKYSDGNCQTKAKKGTGTFEWHKGATLPNVPFTGHSIGSGGLLKATLRYCELPSGEAVRVSRKACAEKGGTEENTESEVPAVECEAENSSGEASGKSSILHVHVTFTGCIYLGFAPCSSAGGKPGEIATEELKGALGYINKSKKEVGVVLEPVKKHGLFAKFVCGSVAELVVGVGNKKEGAYYEDSPGVENHGGNDQVISPIVPVNTTTTEWTQEYTTAGEPPFGNVPHQLEKKKISALESYPTALLVPEFQYQWGAAGEEITNVNVPTESGEIKA